MHENLIATSERTLALRRTDGHRTLPDARRGSPLMASAPPGVRMHASLLMAIQGLIYHLMHKCDRTSATGFLYVRVVFSGCVVHVVHAWCGVLVGVRCAVFWFPGTLCSWKKKKKIQIYPGKRCTIRK